MEKKRKNERKKKEKEGGREKGRKGRKEGNLLLIYKKTSLKLSKSSLLKLSFQQSYYQYYIAVSARGPKERAYI